MQTNTLTIINLARGLLSMSCARQANQRAGLFFFAPDTMRFFDSEVESDLFGPEGKRALFITSERPPRRFAVAGWERRRYTLRAALAGGNVATVGGFGQFPTRAKAEKAARALADEAASGAVEFEGFLLTFDEAKKTA
jgi:hypothetical protein